jgi:TP901 family phage tail tape measure protein
VAESLGRATFDVLLDTTAFRAGIEQVRGLAGRAGQAIEKALGGGASKGTLAGLDLRITSLQQEIRLVEIGSQKYKELQAAIRDATNERKKAEGGQAEIGGLGALGGQLGLAIGAAGAAAVAFNQLKNIDAANAAVRTLGVNSQQLGTELQRVSKELNANISQVELTKAAYDVASAGFTNAADAAKVLKAAAQGAVGGFSDINTVGDAATSVLNAYGLSADYAAKIVDGFIQTQNDGKIIVSQYADQIGRVAPIAAAAGVSIDELNAAISTATAQGVPVESTFAGLRQALSSILKPTEEAQELAQQLGIDFNAQALEAKGLGAFLQDVAVKTKGSADLNNVLFGSIEALAAIQPLLNDELVKYTQNLERQQSSAGAAAKATDTNSKTISGGLNRINNSVSNLIVRADSAFGPLVNGMLDLAAAALSLEPAIAGIAAASAVLAGPALLGAIKGLVISTIAWAKSIAAAAAAQATLIGLSGGGLALVALAVGAGTAAYVALNSQIDEAGKTSDTTIDKIKAIGKEGKKSAEDATAASGAEIDAKIKGLKKEEDARKRVLDIRKQEIDIALQINKARGDSAIDRSGTIKTLLDQELSQAQKLATNDAQRRALELQFGQAKFNQTVAEFDLKARALVSEQQGQQIILDLERQKAALAQQRLEKEAELQVLRAKEAASGGNPLKQAELKAAQDALNVIRQQGTEEQRLSGLRLQALNAQQEAQRDSLTQQRLIALNAQAEFGSVEQQAQLQADVNAELRNQAGYANAAAVSAQNFKAQLQGAADARGDLSTAFQAQVNTVIDGSQQFTTMNNILSTIATNTAKQPVVNVTVNNSGARGNSSGALVSGTSS